MFLAACGGNDDQRAFQVIRTLIETGGSPDCSEKKTGNSMLHIAVQRGHLSTAGFLLATVKVNPKATNHKGETAAFFVNARDEAMIKLLAKHGITKGTIL